MKKNPSLFSTLGRRIAVVGTSGSGKSYVAQKLAKLLGIRYICFDALIWKPNWQNATDTERLERITEALKCDAFTIDGNFGSLHRPDHHLLLQRIDTVIWLDLPRRQAHRQLLWRTIRRCWTKEELWHGNRESWRQAFWSRDSVLWWALTTHALYRRQYARLLADPTMQHLIRIRIRSRAQANTLLKSLESQKQ